MNYDYLIKMNPQKEIDHEFINKSLNGFVPHEWIFINYLFKIEMLRNPEIATIFAMYIFRYYPEFKWLTFNQEDYFTTLLIECSYHDKCFNEAFHGLKVDLTNSLYFGEIVTDFLIRLKNYSLIGISGKKIIVTAKQNCQKVFIDELLKGFSLHRKARIGIKDVPEMLKELYPDVKCLFYKLPVLPTRDIGIPFEELIEDENGVFQRILNKNS